MLATVILAGIVVFGCIAFYDVTAFDIQFHNSCIVVTTSRALLLLFVVEFVYLFLYRQDPRRTRVGERNARSE